MEAGREAPAIDLGRLCLYVMRSIYAHSWEFMAPHPHFDPEAPKKPTNLSLNQDLVRAAKACGLNVSRIAEAALAEAVREKARQAWIEDNAEAVEQYNDRVRTRGAFGDALRRL